MTNGDNAPDRLYELMPAIYRERDAAEGYPLRALLRLVQSQADIVQSDVQQLWDNYFIETCQRWAIPYLGDLVGNNLLHDASRFAEAAAVRELFPDLVGPDLRPPIAIRTRADVAKTIYYRRRKGTLPMLEELARDVTGWAAHAVEFFELLGWTQHLNHLRLFNHDCPDVRRVEPLDRLDGAFDSISHTVDVRRMQPLEGWHNIRNIGFFLWRLRSYRAEAVAARQAGEPWQYHFSPLGNPAPLFSRWRREGDEAGLATELHVPGPIRPAAFFEDLQRFASHATKPEHTDFYGPFEPTSNSHLASCPECSFVIIRDGELVPPNQIRCRDLENWVQPTDVVDGKVVNDVVGVDVRRGRIAFGSDLVPGHSVDVYFHYGSSADLGGGPYERAKWLVDPRLATLHLHVRQNTMESDEYPTLGAAFAEWAAQGRPNTIITVLDNRTYAEPLKIELEDDAWLSIEAANGTRPHLQPDGDVVQIVGDHSGSALTLNGLLIEGAVHVQGDLGRLRLLHSTLVPGRGLKENGQPSNSKPSLIVEGDADGQINAGLQVQIAYSITGPLRLNQHAEILWIADSIVDGVGGTAIAATGTDDQPGPATTMERVTVLGGTNVKKLPLASEVIFTQPIVVTQKQQGCVRFSYVPPKSQTPRRYRCQPALEIASQIERAETEAQANKMTLGDAQRKAIRDAIAAWLVPTFTAEDYGLPGYAQLRLTSPCQIRTGAEDGSEMGIFCHLKQPQRETNLRIRLEEYLPFGLEAGLLYVT